jgi:DNA-binding IclR family transcriptional regulator
VAQGNGSCEYRERVPVKPSQALLRAAELLRVFTERPGEDLSLAELARQVGVNKTTCQSLLFSMVELAWVSRNDPGPTYRLGPGLIPLGESASSSLRVIDAARPELDKLWRSVRLTATAAVLAGDEMVIAAVVGEPHPLGWTIHPGQRLPLKYPTGSVHMAWRDRVAIDAWLDTATPPIGGRAGIHESLAEVRTRGYSVIVVDPIGARPQRQEQARSRELHSVYVSGMDLETQTVQVMTIAAPVFDPRGKVVLSLSLSGMPYDVHASQIPDLGSKVRQAADRVTTTISGVVPAALGN